METKPKVCDYPINIVYFNTQTKEPKRAIRYFSHKEIFTRQGDQMLHVIFLQRSNIFCLFVKD